MKKYVLKIVFVILFFVCRLQADTTWTTGYHEINDGDIYGEIWMYNNCTLDIFGGHIDRLAAYGATVTKWYDGEMYTLWARESSIVNIYGGSLGDIGADGQSIVNLYAYDTILDINTFILSGRYYNNDNFFTIDIHNADVYSHVNIIPEPTTFMLLALGGFLLKKNK